MDTLEERSGVSKRTISEIERGLRAPQTLTLAKLANALGVALEEILEDDSHSPKAGAPSASGLPDEESVEQQRALFGSWGQYLGHLIDSRWRPYLESLPEPPTAQILEAEQPRIEDLLVNIVLVFENLDRYGVREALAPYVDAVESGQPVPESIRQEVIDLQNALTVLFIWVIPKARGWVSRQKDVFEIQDRTEEVLQKWTTEHQRIRNPQA
ncbi:MAG: helix-turn-helix domain-containing protein [Actinomycetota bacterium]|nr:helix-turn-helix domain-containing protein [Actinomycetota bacterium]